VKRRRSVIISPKEALRVGRILFLTVGERKAREIKVSGSYHAAAEKREKRSG